MNPFGDPVDAKTITTKKKRSIYNQLHQLRQLAVKKEVIETGNQGN